MNTNDLILAAESQIDDDGFALIRGVYRAEECRQIVADLVAALAACPDEAVSLRRHNGAVYGARNLLAVFPAARQWWQAAPLVALLSAVLGDGFGLVRGLFFDKPPDGNWSLPWHQDLTIAVEDHSLPSQRFHKRTVKAGVPHVEAPDEVLRQMLTLRIHLDDVTAENGPLEVLPGTHLGHTVQPADRPPVAILAQAGDVLAMRPLLWHRSGAAEPDAKRHRRIIHLEFAGSRALPDGYRWYEFVPAAPGVSVQGDLQSHR